MNRSHAYHIIETAFACGVQEFCICPGARNAPLISTLVKATETFSDKVRYYSWFEERSAAFFAIGRSRCTYRPVAIITTSGTAAAELLPAVMEAHYSGIPLLLITADRPRRFRKTGAPQCAEQVGLFGCYVEFSEDLCVGEHSRLHEWAQSRPAHLNVCFDEPLRIETDSPLSLKNSTPKLSIIEQDNTFHEFERFLNQANNLFVVVGALSKNDQESIKQFLLKLNAPVYLEGLSGLREDQSLIGIGITQIKDLFNVAAQAGYPIDSVLRIGGVPTFRPWRDLEDLKDVRVCSVSPLPFSGLTHGQLIQSNLKELFSKAYLKIRRFQAAQNWLSRDKEHHHHLQESLAANPKTETGLIHSLSKVIPINSMIYLGNSLPIREWDLASSRENRGFTFYANRGVNGIDGQLSTFFGLCQTEHENWALFGDLTTLYDMAGFSVLSQLKEMSITLIIINNGGGQIFAPMFAEKAFLHEHQLSFKPLAEMWGLEYHCWREIPPENEIKQRSKHCLIELIPEKVRAGDQSVKPPSLSVLGGVHS